MIRPNYNPKESLEKMKLLMSYDSSKTLKENEEEILKPTLNELGPTWAAVGAAAASPVVAIPAAAILTILGLNAWMSGSPDMEKKINEFCKACDKTDAKAKEYTTRMALTNIEQARLAKQLYKAYEYQSLGFMGGTDDSEETGWKGVTKILEEKGQYGDVCAIRQMFGSPLFEKRTIDELDDEEQAEFAGALGVVLERSIKGNIKIKNASASGANWWLEQFPCLEVTDSFAPNWSPKVDKYGNSFVDVNFKIKGTLKTFHLGEDGKIYVPTGGGDPTAHKFSGKMVKCATPTKPTLVVAENVVKKKTIKEQAEFDIDITPIDTDLDPEKKTEDENKKKTEKKTIPVPVTQTYKSCPDTFPIEKFCSNETIKKVQGCLGGLVQDGKFGPKTQSALEDKGLLGTKITQFTIDTVCKDTDTKKTKSPDDEYVNTKSTESNVTPINQPSDTGMDEEG